MMLALAVAPAGALAVADGVATYVSALARAERLYMNDAVLAAQSQRDALVGVRDALGALAVAPAIRELRPGPCGAALNDWVAADRNRLLANVTDLDGEIVCSSSASRVGQRLSGSPRFEAFAADPHFGLTVVTRPDVSSRRILLAYAPVRREKRVVGSVSILLRAASIESFLGDLEGGRRYVIVDSLGRIVAGDETAVVADWLPLREAIVDHLALSPKVFSAESGSGANVVYATAPLLDDAVWLVAGAPASGVKGHLLTESAPAIIAPVAMLLIAVAVAYFTIDRLVVRHLLYLARLTRAYGAGRLGLRPRGMERAPREIADFAADLTTMAENLEMRQTALGEAAETNRVLLLEVYHRVKNNLQMIASLLNLQSRRARDDAERRTIERIRSRVHSLALVHQKLYAAQDLAQAPLDELIREIVAPLAAPDPKTGRPAAALDLRLDRVREAVERITAAAMFVNEVATNALKFASRETGAPHVEIALTATPDGGYELVVANDVASGAPEVGADALGERLMTGFAQQLRAELQTGREGGRHVVRLRAPPP